MDFQSLTGNFWHEGVQTLYPMGLNKKGAKSCQLLSAKGSKFAVGGLWAEFGF